MICGLAGIAVGLRATVAQIACEILKEPGMEPYNDQWPDEESELIAALLASGAYLEDTANPAAFSATATKQR